MHNSDVSKQTDLATYVFDGQPHRLAAPLAPWMDSSPRFTAFVETYRDKIRKKIRNTREPEDALDLLSELAIAYALLADRHLAVSYEPYASAKRRGPDFAVTYRRNLVFNIEVARLRVEDNCDLRDELPRKEEHVLRILLNKLGQMQPGMSNLLVIRTHWELAQSIDLGQVMQRGKLRAEAKEPSFYALSRYVSPADFYKDFLHLSGILLWGNQTQTWINKQARPGLDEKVLRLVSALLANVAALPA